MFAPESTQKQTKRKGNPMWIVETEVFITGYRSSNPGKWGPFTCRSDAEKVILALAPKMNVIEARIVCADEPFLSRKQWDELNDIEDKPTKTEDNHE
jgi:hypothetical protein